MHFVPSTTISLDALIGGSEFLGQVRRISFLRPSELHALSVHSWYDCDYIGGVSPYLPKFTRYRPPARYRERLVAAEIRVWNSLLRFGKAGSGTRITRLKGIDNTNLSA